MIIQKMIRIDKVHLKIFKLKNSLMNVKIENLFYKLKIQTIKWIKFKRIIKNLLHQDIID